MKSHWHFMPAGPIGRQLSNYVPIDVDEASIPEILDEVTSRNQIWPQAVSATIETYAVRAVPHHPADGDIQPHPQG